MRCIDNDWIDFWNLLCLWKNMSLFISQQALRTTNQYKICGHNHLCVSLTSLYATHSTKHNTTLHIVMTLFSLQG